MKKKLHLPPCDGILTKQKKLILWIMKKSLFFLIAFFSITSFGYTQVFSLKLGKVSLRECFDKIRKEGNVALFYSDDELDVSKLVEVRYKNKSALEMISDLVGSDYDVKLMDNSVIAIMPSLKKATIIEEVVDITITGKITNESGQSVIGANVLLKGTKRAVQTDLDGNFSIKVPDGGGTLVISYVGSVTQEIKVSKTNTNLKVVLKQESQKLDDVVINVAFGKQKKKSVVSSITTINPSELRIASSNLTTALAGRIAGLISYQRGGEPGRDNAEFFVRGVTSFGNGASNPLILIDGVELDVSDLRRLHPDDIASFSVMKDATATALYGARGANGVIFVTTKEGKEGSVKISARVETSLSMATSNLKFADPVTYMNMANEAQRNIDPISLPVFSQEKIDNTIAGKNPQLYPAIDWQKALFKDYSINKRVNFSLNGGGEVARYYVSVSGSQDNGPIDVPSINNYNSNVDFKVFNLRSNTNINLTKTSKLKLSFDANFETYNGPINGGTEVYRQVVRSNPVLFQPFYVKDEANEFTNHILFGNARDANGNFYLNPYAELVRGYRQDDGTKIIAQLEFNQDLKFITKGLNFKTILNTTKEANYSVTRQLTPYYYSASLNALTDKVVLSELRPGTEYLDYVPGNRYIASNTYFESNFTYNKSINDKHDLSGLLVFTLNNRLISIASNLQESLPFRNMGVSGRFTYGYNQKYFAEFNFGFNGSERFAANHRYGFFPAFGVGWLVSNEKFFEKYTDVVNKLKLKATYGLVGNDKIGDASDRFFYLSQINFNSNGGYVTGQNFDNYLPGVSIQRYANDNITWETGAKINLGVELSLFRALDLNIDVYRENRSNIVSNRLLPSTLGLQADVKANFGKVRSQGVDVALSYKKDFKNGLWAQVSGNFTYATNKITEIPEPDYSATPWLSRVGQSIGQQWGFVAERLFVDQAEVNNSPKQEYGPYSGGDVKYKDINGDGKITDLDRVPIGSITPEIIFGSGFSVGYKNVDLSCFFQGSSNSSFSISRQDTEPFVGNKQLLQAYADNHWSPETKNVYALWPRFSSITSNNNNQRSTWFIQDGAFLRLKTVEIGYSLSEKLNKKLKLEKVRIYASGVNIFTLSKFKLWDPELGANGLGYPNQRVFNLGLNVSF